MDSKIFPGKLIFVLFLINLVKETLSDLIVKSPLQLADKFKGIIIKYIKKSSLFKLKANKNHKK